MNPATGKRKARKRTAVPLSQLAVTPEERRMAKQKEKAASTLEANTREVQRRMEIIKRAKERLEEAGGHWEDIQQEGMLSPEEIIALNEQAMTALRETVAHSKTQRTMRALGGLTNAQRLRLSDMMDGVTPLAILISIAKDEGAEVALRIDAAKAALPYVHKKKPIGIEGGDKPIQFMGATFDPSALSKMPEDRFNKLLEVISNSGLVIDADAQDVTDIE